MSDAIAIRPVLTGHKALVVGIANGQSIAYGCAKAFRTAGADIAVTWLNEKARPYVEPLAAELEAPITAALDVAAPGEMEAVFDLIRERWGKLDILVIRSPLHPGRIWRAACSIARPRDSPSRWISPVIRSSAWRSSRRR